MFVLARKRRSRACVTLVLEALLIFLSELGCSSHLLTSCYPGMYQLFHSSAAAILCSKATCGLSLWRCSRAHKSVCDGSRLCLLRACRLWGGCWVSPRPRFTSSPLVTWEGSLLIWLLRLLFFSSGNSAKENWCLLLSGRIRIALHKRMGCFGDNCPK